MPCMLRSHTLLGPLACRNVTSVYRLLAAEACPPSQPEAQASLPLSPSSSSALLPDLLFPLSSLVPPRGVALCIRPLAPY
eukprot:3798112-Rhodomonas_salina.2